MIEKRTLYSSEHHSQQEPHSTDEHPLMCKNCHTDENSNPMTPQKGSACSYDTRRRPFPTLLYPRLPWNSNGKCQGCVGKEQQAYLFSDATMLDQYATTRMLDLAAEEELEAAEASGDLERIREAKTILDFNKKAT